MPKKNQIQFLCPSRETPGATYHWKPSPKYRRAGWTNLKLGTDWKAAVVAAIARNDELAEWESRGGDSGLPRKAPHRRRWKDLVDAYKADTAFTGLKPKTQAEYRSRIGTLTLWALNGDLVLSDLDRAMVMDLRNALVADGRKHRTAALLRVLRILVNYGANQGWIAAGIADAIDIPEAPSRKRILSAADVQRLVDRARAMDDPRTALAILLGYWIIQREGDMLALNNSPFCWRRMDDMSPFARKVLAGPDGFVIGFRLQQAKTGAWVDLPLPYALRAEVEAMFAANRRDGMKSGLLFPDVRHDRAMPDWKFQRRFRAVAAAEGIEDVQYRDLRRSGMVHMGGLGVEIQFITAMSGHAVLGNKKTILDTYMPGNSRFAAEGMAIAWSRWQERVAEEREREEEGCR